MPRCRKCTATARLLSGTVDPQGGHTTYQIEYGTYRSLWQQRSRPEGELPNSLGKQSFSQQGHGPPGRDALPLPDLGDQPQ